MRTISELLVAVALVANFCVPGAATAADSIDTKVTELMTGISDAANKPESDTTSAANSKFKQFLKAASASKGLFIDPLVDAQAAGLTVLESKDKKLRVYSWDSLTGGTMHFYESVAQFDVGGKYAYLDLNGPDPKEDEDPGPGALTTDLRTYETVDHKFVYLLLMIGTYSGMDHSHSISAYVIDGGKLKTFPFFDTGKKRLSTIDCSFSSAQWNEGANIQFGKDGKTMKIPIIDKNNAITGKFLLYAFNGNAFKFAAGK